MTLSHPDKLVADTSADSRKHVFVIGATGTIGRATVRALLNQGYGVVCFVRQRAGGALLPEKIAKLFDGVSIRYGDVSDPVSLTNDGFKGEQFDVVISCLASRTGAPKDAWAIDHQAHMHVLEAAKRAGVNHFVLLSAICVQKPLLAFQHAKLAFENALMESGMTYSIVRPTAFFKSLSGQLERVKKGKPFLLFGDGTLTACKPKAISKYNDKNLAIGWGTSKSERNKPAAMPKTKNRIAGSRRFCIVIFLLMAMIKTFIHIVKSIL